MPDMQPTLVKALKRLTAGEVITPKLYGVLRHKQFVAARPIGGGHKRVAVTDRGHAWLTRQEASR